MFIATESNANLIKEQFEDVEMGHSAVKLGPGLENTSRSY